MMKTKILLVLALSCLSSSAFANAKADLLRAELSSVLHSSEEETSVFATMKRDIEIAKSSGREHHTFEMEGARAEEMAILHASGNGQTANVSALVTWNNNSGMEHISFRVTKSQAELSELSIESAQLVGHDGPEVIVARTIKSPLGDVHANSTYTLPVETSAEHTLRSQDNYSIEASYMHTKIDLQRRNTGLWYNKEAPDLQGKLVHTVTALKDNFPEGHVEAFEINPHTGNATLYMTHDTAEGGTVYAREVTITSTGAKTDASVKYGEARALTELEIQELGIFSAKVKAIATRTTTTTPAAGVHIKDAGAE